MKFLAAVLNANNTPLDLCEIELNDKLKFGQILVEMITTGICGKQIEEIEGKMGKDKYIPHLLGHEGYGKVIDYGPGVKKVKKDDYVILHWIKGNGIESETPKYYINNRKINAGWVTTFNSFSVVSENRLTVVDKQEDTISMPLFGCAVPTGIGTVVNQANARPEHSVAVIGTGGVGLNCILGGKIINCKEIICYDEKVEARKLAKSVGADDCVQLDNPSYDNFDIVLDTVANKESIEKAINITKYNGIIYVIGVPSPKTKVELNALNLHRNIRIEGSSGGNIIPEIHIPTYINMHNKGIINVKKIVSSVYKFNDINKALKRISNGKEKGRIVIQF